jgi:hypothetical protein
MPDQCTDWKTPPMLVVSERPSADGRLIGAPSHSAQSTTETRGGAEPFGV